MPATPRGDLTFIETQLPIARLSVESFTERDAKAGQTLTALGRWWGRKPLILCRATILGLLLPATDDPAMDREVFLRLLTMDEAGMLERRSKNIPLKVLFEHLAPSARRANFTDDSTTERAQWRPGTDTADKEDLQKRVFLSMPYDARLAYCFRPEQISGPSEAAWRVINGHLGTAAANLAELVEELGTRRFGRRPRVGDSFSGGGSVAFEAARIGCDASASDLNPMATLLTWGALNITGGGDAAVQTSLDAQKAVFAAVDRQICEWGVEHRPAGNATGRTWRADVYMYCVEATCPECKWSVPLCGNWTVSEPADTHVGLVARTATKDYGFVVYQGSSQGVAVHTGPTIVKGYLHCPRCPQPTPMASIRGEQRGGTNALRQWTQHDIVPASDDILRERLYCIRWVDEQTDSLGRVQREFVFAAPTEADLRNEARVVELVRERLEGWQASGVIAPRRIEPGTKTDEPIRTRGWTHWHHLFAPRQLLLLGLLSEAIDAADLPPVARIGCKLSLSTLADWNSRLCRLRASAGNEARTENTFYNQALNTLWNFGVRPMLRLNDTFLRRYTVAPIAGAATVECGDARNLTQVNDIWITDPPYADAIAYDELTEFFLAWIGTAGAGVIPGWTGDSRRSLAVRGSDHEFREAMVQCYSNLARHMPDNGLQVVMFTHQDTGVWADLALVLWAAGLRVTAAWCVATETGPATSEGNYVQGTVLLILRKRTSAEEVFLDEIHADIEAEVRRQLDTMRAIDDVDQPNFADTDYQLAAYAAALRVITERPIAEINPERELRRARAPGERSPLHDVIESAKKLASDHLVPRGLERDDWKRFTAIERFYLKGVEMEAHGERRVGAYQESARGFGAVGYEDVVASFVANQARLKTPSEFASRNLRTANGFGAAPLRDLLFAVHIVARGDSPRDALQWLKTELTADGYREHRRRFVQVADYLAALQHNSSLVHWQADAKAAELLAGALRNDHV